MSDKPNGWSGCKGLNLTAELLFVIGLLAFILAMISPAFTAYEQPAAIPMAIHVAVYGLLFVFCSGLLKALNNIALALLGKTDKSQ